MNLEQMEKEQRDNVRVTVSQSLTLLGAFKNRQVSLNLWQAILRLLWPVVKSASVRSGTLARDFYDSERSRVFPTAPRHDFFLAELSFEQFVEHMHDLYPSFRRKTTLDHEVNRAGLRIAKEIESTARFTMRNAIETPDPWFEDLDEDAVSFAGPVPDSGESYRNTEPSVRFDDDTVVEIEESSQEEVDRRRAAYFKKNIGVAWARVATGLETCGWCLTLVSRGPVYHSKETAGGNWEFHDGCDCKVVPVFDLENWDGRERYLAAQEMWRMVPGHGKDAINEMRKLAADGEFARQLAKQKKK